jgi:hypothetical protein
MQIEVGRRARFGRLIGGSVVEHRTVEFEFVGNPGRAGERQLRGYGDQHIVGMCFGDDGRCNV